MQIRVELQTYMDGKAGPESSTLFINNKDNVINELRQQSVNVAFAFGRIYIFQYFCNSIQWLLAHNEDTSVGAFDKCYIVVASIFEFQKIGACSTTYEHFMAFCYPGIIPGSSFSCNFHGLVLTVNELYSKNMETNNMRQYLKCNVIRGKEGWGGGGE